MQFIADLHIHSKYSRAVSKDMVPEELDRWADDKGILVMGTGDFTHPAWFKELREKLSPAERGLFKLKSRFKKETLKGTLADTRFMLTVEISCIYSRGGKTRRVHHIVMAPDFETAEKINTQLSWVGKLASDGRPILGLDSEELAKIVFNANPEAVMVPAHCLLPNTLIHTKDNLLKPIKEIQSGDFVISHKNQWREVKEVFRRPYNGAVYCIKPRYLSPGLITTSEHPFYAIKTNKNCHWSNGICKPSHENLKDCKHQYFKDYKPQWITANKLERGDVLIYPRFKDIFNNHKVLDIKEIVNASGLATRINGEFLTPMGSKVTGIKQIILIDKNFCRLAGYYVAEGYTNSRDLIGFAFSNKEQEYVREVADLMKSVFGFDKEPKLKINRTGGIEILFYSKILCEAFRNLFYSSSSNLFNASTKSLPLWTLGLSSDLQVEIFRCWWRGDAGYTVSRLLLNQMKIILLRLGIAPSIYIHKRDTHNFSEHLFRGRKIEARYDLYCMNRLTFFEDKFNLLKTKEFFRFNSVNDRKYGWLDDNYIYLPIYDIQIENYKGEVYNLEVEKDNSYTCEFATVHNCWTPWFSVFGSMSGFDSLEECFGKYTDKIFAVETGLSSDPPMNWRVRGLDNIALISNSDSHSLQRIGREANVFDTELSYAGIMEAIKNSVPASRINADPLRQSFSEASSNAPDQRGNSPRRPLESAKSAFLYTIEFFPEEGKYHYDGHRACGVVMPPSESKKLKDLCPKCGKKMTIGVVYRVDQLADPKRPEGYRDAKRVPFKNLVTLDSIIGEALDVGKATKSVMKEYEKLIKAFKSEFNALLNAPIKEIALASRPEIAEGVERMRNGRLSIQPGYDGEFGVIEIFDEEDRKKINSQSRLF